MSKSYQFGLLGHRISFSLSPDIFRAIARHTNTEILYSLIDVPIEKLSLSLQELVHRGFDGFSVTIPHKSRIMKYLTEIESTAEAIGAVNSVRIYQGELVGYNTDAYGFSSPLEEYRDQLKGRPAIIVGSGGAARAVLYSLLTDFAVSQVFVCARTMARTTQLQADAMRFAEDQQVVTCLMADFDRARDAKPAILVNCTPLGGFSSGGAPIESVPFAINAASIYYDLNYNDDNLLVANAYRAGVTAIDGTTMLVKQAVRSFELWTGMSAPFESVYADVFGRISDGAREQD